MIELNHPRSIYAYRHEVTVPKFHGLCGTEVICCGINETKVEVVALADIELIEVEDD